MDQEAAEQFFSTHYGTWPLWKTGLHHFIGSPATTLLTDGSRLILVKSSDTNTFLIKHPDWKAWNEIMKKNADFLLPVHYPSIHYPTNVWPWNTWNTPVWY